jgi:hypothetical protein
MTHPGGRPTEYDPKYCDMIIEYFDRALEEEKTFKTKRVENGKASVTEVTKMVATNLPTFEGFAHEVCGVSYITLRTWKKKYPEFLIACDRAKEIQMKIWMLNSLNGNYNANFSKFVGANVFGWKEKSEETQTISITQMPSIKIGGEEVEFEVGD